MITMIIVHLKTGTVEPDNPDRRGQDGLNSGLCVVLTQGWSCYGVVQYAVAQ